MKNDNLAYPDYCNFRTCSNCGNCLKICGELVCQWHEAYVSQTGKCLWWVKKVE